MMSPEPVADRASGPRSTLRADFDRDGFTRLPRVIDAAQVGALREELIQIFDAPSAYDGDVNGHVAYNRIYFDAFNRYPALQWVAFHPPVVSALRDVLGKDYVYIPEVGIHDSGFGGWHKDTTAQEVAGLRFHWESDFRMVQCALYLQDNHPDYAGGLDVAVGSHRRRDRIVPRANGRLTKLATRALYKLKTWDDDRRRTTVRTTAGDLVIFHYRLDHKATTPRIRPLPSTHRKLALFFVASANNAHARAYMRFIKSREDYVYLKSYVTTEAYRAKAEAAGVGLLDP
jgi:hypothetical protein